MSGRGPVDGQARTMRIRLLGGFEVSVGSRTIEEGAWRLRKAASLVKLLALSRTHRLHREQVMDALWPELGTDAASNNLRQALHAARRTLEPGRAANSRYLSLREKQLALCPGERLWVDVEAFKEAAATARRSRDPAAYGLAVELYAGELLPGDRYEEWTEGRREELRQLHLALLVELAGLYEEGGEHDAGVEALLRAAAEDPALEKAHAGLMRLYALSGRRTLALTQYDRLRKVLAEKLEIEPDASTRRLHEEIAAGTFQPDEPTAPTPKEPRVEGKHNLPAPRSSFIGREAELRDLKRDLAMTRLLTLTGAGGCGKTRLALEAARDLVGAYPGGVWLVELASLCDADLVAQAVAAVLGVQERPDRPLTDTLVDFLRARRALLVLDNCEHLVDAVARLADVLLDSCPHLKVLATSREGLNVEGDLNRLVPSLSAPIAGRPQAVDELAGYDAVRLFLERVGRRSPSFSLTPENADAVARICGRLEGMPLAIELAAARVGLSVEQIATRLDDSLGLLTSGSRTASPRHRTLRGTLDWSYELLGESERRLFCQLSVFAGGWTLQAAEVVGAGDTEQGDVLELLARLVEKSLVGFEPTGGGGGARYRLLEPIRQYALERLEDSGKADDIRRRHAAFFLALAEEAEPGLWGPEEPTWLQRLDVEHDNLRAALTWALERGEADLGLRLAGALRWFWLERGYNSEGRRWYERVLAMDKGRASATLRIKVLDAAGWLALELGDLDRTEAVAREGIELSEDGVIPGILAAPFFDMLGMLTMRRGDYRRAETLFEQSLALNREAGDKRGLTFSLFNLGAVAQDRGDRERAKELYEESRTLCRALGDVRSLPKYSYALGYECLLEGDYARATELFEEAVAMCRERGRRNGLNDALDKLAWAELARGNHVRATSLYEEGLALCVELDDRWIAPESLEGLACVAAAKGDSGRAARLFGAARALHEALDYHQPPLARALREPYLASAAFRLSEAAWEAALAEGKTMGLREAIEYALSEDEPSKSALSQRRSPTSLSPESEGSSSSEPPTLTPREEEVALLVTHGLTNRQIAQQLVLSRHTVDKHVKNILKKLALRSREQVASRLRGQ